MEEIIRYKMLKSRRKTIGLEITPKGNLNFNCLVMLAPKEVQDHIIVHELCHRLEMNHLKRFWELVGSILPDYKKSEKWLNTEGKLIMLRAFEAE